MLRNASYFARRAAIAAVAALAAGCTQDPVRVVERGFPAADPARISGTRAAQPTRLTLQSGSYRNEDTEPPLLFWEIRKEGK